MRVLDIILSLALIVDVAAHLLFCAAYRRLRLCATCRALLPSQPAAPAAAGREVGR